MNKKIICFHNINIKFMLNTNKIPGKLYIKFEFLYKSKQVKQIYKNKFR